MSIRSFARGLFVLVAVPALAGCLATPEAIVPAAVPDLRDVVAKLTRPIYDRVLRESLTMESFDGTPLYVEVFRPEVPAGVLLPTILVNTPYQTDEDLQGVPYDRRLHDHFVPRGYAVAFGDVRGTHNSGGCIPMTSMDQARDAAAMVEFLAAQPWSSGKVGMFGISYDGETQLGAAVLNPPHLVTIVPASTVASGYLWYFQNGVPYLAQWAGSTFYAQTTAVPGHTPSSLADYPSRVPCNLDHHTEAMDATSDGRMTAYWKDRDYRPLARNVTASVFQLHGLQDWNVKPINLLGWFDALPGPKKGWFGQWTHTYPTREDFTLAVHRWYDHWLMGIDTGLMDEPPVQLQDSLGRWHDAAGFPPPDAVDWTLHLRRDALNRHNRLSPEPPLTDEPPQGWVDSRLAVVTRAAGTASSIGPLGVEAPDPLPPPRLLYTTEALQEDVQVAGAPEVRLFLSVSRGSTHIAAHLYDIAPDGTSLRVNRGYQDTLFRHGLDAPEPMAEDEVAELRFTMNPQDTVFQAGHRIGLALMSLDGFIEQDPNESEVTIYHDPARPSGVVLPLVSPARFHLVPDAPAPGAFGGT